MAEQSLQTLNRQRKEQEWAGRIKACRESGLGVQAWCAEQGLSYHTYYKWQQRRDILHGQTCKGQAKTGERALLLFLRVRLRMS